MTDVNDSSRAPCIRGHMSCEHVAPVGRPVRVLVVDDEDLIRWSFGEYLRRRGFAVSVVACGEEALERLTVDAPEIMVLDYHLPGIDGLETLARALVVCPGLLVIMMSAHSHDALVAQAQQHGAREFLIKPVGFAALQAALDRAQASLHN